MREVLPSTKHCRDQGNSGRTYAQEFELKQPLICYFEPPSEKVVALFHERSDMREGEMRECSRSILAGLIGITEKHD